MELVAQHDVADDVVVVEHVLVMVVGHGLNSFVHRMRQGNQDECRRHGVYQYTPQ